MNEDEGTVEVDVRDLLRSLDDYEARVKNLPMDVYAMLLVSKVDEMFQTEGASGTDGPWQPLSASTLRRHPRRRGGQLLQDSGATAASVGAEEQGHVISLYAGTAQTRFHIQGTEFMPRRDFFALNFPLVLEELASLVAQELG